MESDRFRKGDTAGFLGMAAAEGWISDRWEIDFLRQTFSQGCRVRRIEGVPAAFVTAIGYGRSGWVGNLLVHPALRRRGIGVGLMSEAIEALERAGVATVWLTASPSGRPLYERLGFRELDQVDRWLGEGLAIRLPTGRHLLTERQMTLDAAGWGDRRETLLSALGGEGSTIIGEDAFLVTRTVGTFRQIGPWCGTAAAAGALFEQHVATGTGGEGLCLDVPRANGVMGHFLERHGLKRSGATSLMYRGAVPAYRPELIGACASMGSMG